MIRILSLFLLIPLQAHAAWMGPSSEPPAIPERLNRIFPASTLKVPINCRLVTSQNGMLFGSSDPASGSVQSFRPELPFWQWWSTCIRSYVEQAKSSSADLKEWLGPDLAKWLEDTKLKIEVAQWSQVPKDLKELLAESVAGRILGGPVAEEFGTNVKKIARERLLSRVNTAATASTTLISAVEMLYAVALSMDEFWVE